MKLFTCIAFALLASSVHAGESWLAASDWEPRPGEEVRLSAHQGSGFAGDALAWRRSSVHRLVLRGAEETDLAASARDEQPGFPAFTPSDDGGSLVAWESRPSILELRAAEMDLHVADEGLAGVARMRRGSTRRVRESRTTCAKLWIEGTRADRVTEPAGLTLELVPRRDPARVESLRLQLLFRGRPVTGALVKSWRQPFDEQGEPVPGGARLDLPLRERAITDRRGMVRLDVAPHGEYLVSAVHAVPCRDPHSADWDAWWASLSFARGAGAPLSISTEPRRLRGSGLGTNPDLGDPGFERSTSRRDVPGWGRSGLRL